MSLWLQQLLASFFTKSDTQNRIYFICAVKSLNQEYLGIYVCTLYNLYIDLAYKPKGSLKISKLQAPTIKLVALNSNSIFLVIS